MKRTTTLLVAFVLLAILLGSLGLPSARAANNSFANDAFTATWSRTDELVASGVAKRSYYWGPGPNTAGIYEQYVEGKDGQHLVQYFDKSRMEINNPDGELASPFYVTNGLLTEELITGKMQVGNSKFVERKPADIPLASDGDDPNAPTYASFRDHIGPTKGSYIETVNQSIARDGSIRTDSRYANYGVKQEYFEPATSHNIPLVFWSFLNASGPVLVGGKQQNAKLNDPYFYATGYPISEAYWASVKIAGQASTDVLIQAFERRVLTYVPSAAEGFKVQMGNIGQHYYKWRYQDSVPTITPTAAPVALTCNGSLPKRGFGKLWGENTTVQQQLGCTANVPESVVAFAQQPFQHGQMIDVLYRNGSGYYGFIYALYEDGTSQRFADTFVGSKEAEPQLTPPAGLYAPRAGFAKVWRDETAARVAEKLGWATGPLYEAGPSNNVFGAAQDFELGLMVYSGPSKKIYVLYGGKTDRYSNQAPTKWGVYDDTFNG